MVFLSISLSIWTTLSLLFWIELLGTMLEYASLPQVNRALRNTVKSHSRIGKESTTERLNVNYLKACHWNRTKIWTGVTKFGEDMDSFFHQAEVVKRHPELAAIRESFDRIRLFEYWLRFKPTTVLPWRSSSVVLLLRMLASSWGSSSGTAPTRSSAPSTFSDTARTSLSPNSSTVSR